MVIGGKELADFVERRGAQVVRRSDRDPVIRMIGRKERGRDRHAGKPVGTVLVILPPLVEHDVALVLELLLRQRGQQIAHPIGFHPERELERAGRDHFPVVRAIGVGRAVEQPAGLLQGWK
jgi:hypothetical protein